MLKNRLLVKYLSGFDQNIAKLPWQCPFKDRPNGAGQHVHATSSNTVERAHAHLADLADLAEPM